MQLFRLPFGKGTGDAPSRAKASKTIHPADGRDIAKEARHRGRDFQGGILFSDGKDTFPLETANTFAVPLDKSRALREETLIEAPRRLQALNGRALQNHQHSILSSKRPSSGSDHPPLHAISVRYPD